MGDLATSMTKAELEDLATEALAEADGAEADEDVAFRRASVVVVMSALDDAGALIYRAARETEQTNGGCAECGQVHYP